LQFGLCPNVYNFQLYSLRTVWAFAVGRRAYWILLIEKIGICWGEAAYKRGVLYRQHF
jgi:hypothetical protein